ncbi:hypothetical protein QOZ80_4AG0323070 [Eleusine coracana subsp. coracana]|nr:hypothetical protein QOZ80_4AG0323070 [Eleusine coracana subsp. coracana]
MTTTARCPGAVRLRSRWTARALAGAFIDLFLAWAFLCFAALASAAVRALALLGISIPCTCARPHLPCLLAFLARYPARALHHIHASLRSRFPFDDDQRQQWEEEAAAADGDGDPRRELEEVRAEMQRELEKERSASASAAEEAMAMILRLQKEKSALEIDARQQRRAAEERSAFHEDELEELRDIVLLREREARALRKEVDSYRRLLGLATEEEGDDEDEVMVTPRSVWPESQPSSSRSVGVQLGNDSGFSFQTPFSHQEFVTPFRDDLDKGRIDDYRIAVQTPNEVPVVESKQEQDSCEDDGAETVEILPHSARSLDFDQGGGDFHVDAAAGTEEEKTSDEFQEGACADKISRDHSGSENDSNIFDVHVVDDMCFSKEVKGLIGRSFSDATMQTERFQIRAAADDLLVKSLNAVKSAQDKIKLAASERRESLQLQLLEDIAIQLQGIKDAAEAERHMYCASPKKTMKN